MLITEDAILKPKDPRLKNSDDWPNFLLKNVNITNQQTGQQVSLLSAHKGNPVRVTGQLDEVEDEYRSLGNIDASPHRVSYLLTIEPVVREERYQSLTIELKDVTTYAFAEYDDGTNGFWAAGTSGWFEVSGVSTKYQTIFNEMLEAASMLYMLADKLRRSTRRQKLNNKELKKYIRRLFRDVNCSVRS